MICHDGDDPSESSKRRELQDARVQLAETRKQCDGMRELNRRLESELTKLRNEVHILRRSRDAGRQCEELRGECQVLSQRIAEAEEEVKLSRIRNRDEMAATLKLPVPEQKGAEVKREQKEARQCRQLLEQADEQARKHITDRQQWALEKLQLHETCRVLEQEVDQLLRRVEVPLLLAMDGSGLHSSVPLLESELPRLLNSLETELGDALTAIVLREVESLDALAQQKEVTQKLLTKNVELRSDRTALKNVLNEGKLQIVNSRNREAVGKEVLASTEKELENLSRQVASTKQACDEAVKEAARWHEKWCGVMAELHPEGPEKSQTPSASSSPAQGAARKVGLKSVAKSVKNVVGIGLGSQKGGTKGKASQALSSAAGSQPRSRRTQHVLDGDYIME